MTAKRPNVLLLTVDALRADRLSVYGYERPTTPTLERFARHATVCENAFTLGPFTQVACIQLFTSSRPLSYGGYDRGAVGRPDNLFKQFQEAGYHTSGLSTIHWVSPYYGYTDGLDEDVGLFLLNTVAGMAFNNMRDTIDAYHQGKITEADMLATATPVLRRFFENVNHYSDRFLAHGKTFKADYPDAKAVRDGYDYRKVKKVVANHRRAFERHPAAYIRDQLHRAPDPHEWIAADWRYSRTPGKLIGEAVSRLGNRILGVVSASRAVARANRFRMSIDAHAIADKIVRQLRDRPREKPFFIWAHFKDTHMPYVSGPGRHWYRHTPRYLEMLGYPPGLDPLATFAPRHPRTAEERATVSALYDAAIRSTDEAIGKILDTLDSLDLAGDTVVGICGDHGEELGDHGDYGHRVMHYEHNARIPMMFRHGRGKGRRIDSLVTTMDWAPTVADLAGIDPAPGWEGSPVTSPVVAEREHVLMEAFCRGNCLFDHRPPYMAVRTRSHKYIWHEYVDVHHENGVPGPLLFDLGTDPAEQNTIYRPDHPLVARFNGIIAQRWSEIPQISPERITAAFGTAWRKAS